ncbi:MAG: tyrosyl-tRNA synthetase, partial [Parcubacteria group bacterium Athens0714_25]
FVISAKLIADDKTGMLMSKSNGTGIFLDLDSNDLFGAIMSQPDGMIHPLLLGCTRIVLDEIKELMKLENPRDAKVRLAHEIVKIYHGEEKAQEAEEYFVNTFSKKEIPEEVREVKARGDINLIDFLVLANVATSKGDARRKIEQGGVSIDGEKITDPNKVLDISFSGKIIKVGKKDFVKIVF